MKDETPIPPQKCSKCGYLIDATGDAYGNAKPRPGDISMCLSCGHITKFGQGLALRELTPGEAREISLLPEVFKAQLARDHLIGDKLKRRKIPVQ